MIFISNHIFTKIIYPTSKQYLLSPNHFIYHTRIRLDEFYDYITYIFAYIYINRSTIITICIHRKCNINSLQKTLFVNTSKNEPRIVK